MRFDIVSPNSEIETIAAGSGVRDRVRLRRAHGRGRWRKLKGVARVELQPSGETFLAGIHWYEASGIGRREFKIKRRLE